MKGSDFVFDFADGLHYKYHEVSLNKKATTNPKNNDTMCIKHVEMVALNQNHGKISTENTKD